MFSFCLFVCLFRGLRLGFEHPTFRMRGERSNRLRHRGGHFLVVVVGVEMLFEIQNPLYFYFKQHFSTSKVICNKHDACFNF